MRILEIEENVERSLQAVFNAALRAGGMQMLDIVNKTATAVKSVENNELGKKCLNYDGDIDRDLNAIIDVAFKAAGLGVYWSVQEIVKAIVEKQEEAPSETA